MIIHPPQLTLTPHNLRLSAAIEVENAQVTWPDEVWFEFPRDHQDFITDRLDGFVAALLISAMELGESVEVRGTVSPRLMLGLIEVQRLFHFRFPDRFKVVEIKAGSYARESNGAGIEGVACAFSGGIDSFYTLRNHLSENEQIPGFSLTHALFIDGFDIPLDNEATYSSSYLVYKEVLADLGVQLLSCRTNLRKFGLPWALVNEIALVSVALHFGNLLRTFYISSSQTAADYARFYPGLSQSHLIDHLLSTETLEIIHDADTVARVEKTNVGFWPVTWGRLRVCWEKPNGLANCGQCAKCIRTMATLELLGILDQHPSFPLPLEHKNIRNCRFLGNVEQSHARELIKLAKENGRWDVLVSIQFALLRSRIIQALISVKLFTTGFVNRLVGGARNRKKKIPS